MRSEDVKFDEDLRNIFPRPSDSKLELMAESFNENGLIDYLITCKGVLVDGYIRYELCKKLGIPIRYKEMEFESKDDAKFFKIQNQCAQRELTVFQKCEILYPFEKFISERVLKQKRETISKLRRGIEVCIERDKHQNTGDIIAMYAGTVRPMWFRARALIEEADEETKKLLRSGELKITPAYQQLRADEALARDMASFDSVIDDKVRIESASQSNTSASMQDKTKKANICKTVEISGIPERKSPATSDGCEADRIDENTEVTNTVDAAFDDIGFGREAASAAMSTQNHGNHSADDTDTAFPRACNIHFNMGAPLEAELEAELAAEGDTADTADSDDEDWSTDDVNIDNDPYISEIDINNPDTHLPEVVPNFPEMPKRNPIPFPLVRQQVQYSVQTMLFELLVGLCGLRDDDLDRRDEILEIVKYGFKKAKKLIERETTNR